MIEVFGRIGCLSFGGPAAQIALMHRVLVEEERWIDEGDFSSALGFCMLLPGPEAMQLATYAGWRLRGIPGGLIAGGLFVLPGALVILALAAAYAAFGSVPAVAALFLGIKAAVLVIVIEALLKLARRALPGPWHRAVALLSFAGLFFFAIPFPLVLLAGAIWGWWMSQGRASTVERVATSASARDTLAVLGVGGVLWAGPLIAIWAISGRAVLAELALFFSWLAVVTFGGAYAVLSYMAEAAVVDRGWLSPGAMIDGLGLAETTPGPLILVTEFVGFMAGYAAGGLALAVLAAVVTLWATFVPCFIWIFAGAPWIGGLAGMPRLAGAMDGIKAVVVGVILNISVWFALHVLFAQVSAVELGWARLWVPDPGTLDWRVPVLVALAWMMLVRLRFPLVATLIGCGLGGLALSAL